MPSLVAIDEPYTEELQAELLDSLKTKGFCVCVRAEPPDRLPQVTRCHPRCLTTYVRANRLPDVWERDSVTAYEAQIRQLAGPGARFGVHANAIPEENQADSWWLPNDCPEFIEPIRAQRIRSMLPAALIPSPQPRSKIQCFEQAWVVDPKLDAQHCECSAAARRYYQQRADKLDDETPLRYSDAR